MTAPSSLESLKSKLDGLVAEFRAAMALAADEQAVRKVYADFGGPAGAIRVAQKDALKAAPGPEKRAIGELGNAYLKEIDDELEQRLAAIADEARERDLARRVDVTLPGRARRLGHLHPLTIVAPGDRGHLRRSSASSSPRGPRSRPTSTTSKRWRCRKDHPARDMQDTFYIAGAGQARSWCCARTPRRCRSGPCCARQPPVRIIAPGAVYRATTTPRTRRCSPGRGPRASTRGVSFGGPQGHAAALRAQASSARTCGVRLRPSFFPFTEPSAEIDISCVFCRGRNLR